METERRMNDRFVISLPIRVEWDDTESGRRMIEEGRTENIGLTGTLVHLPKNLPRVGSRVTIQVFEAKGAEVVALEAQVLRVERDPAHPLAALRMYSDAADEWRKNVCDNRELIEAFSESAEEYDD